VLHGATPLYDQTVSPRLVRDPTAIKVSFPPFDLGSGSPEHGGGLLRGGVTLANRLTAEIEDPVLPYAITVVVTVRDGFLTAESITIAERPGGPPLSSVAIRSTGLSLYVQRVREEIPRQVPHVLLEEKGRTEGTVSFGFPPVEADWDAFAQMRRATRLSPEVAAEAYLEALASPDPEKNRKPTQAAADKLGISRGHAGRLITEARKKGIPGLGPGRPSRRKHTQ
jgi:hypothetical protein